MRLQRRTAPHIAAGCIALLVAGAASGATPHFNYLMHCAGCHLAQGEGAPPLVPALRDNLGLLLTREGARDYLVRVPGAYQTPVSDAELAALINFVLRTFNAETLPNDFVPYSAEEVARYRAWPVLSDPLARRRELWDVPESSRSGPAY